MKRIRLGIAATIVALVLALGMTNTQTASAQNPVTWQTNATGLRTQLNGSKKTAGLGFIVQQQSWPFLFLRGGVKAGDSWFDPKVAGPTDIELGQVKIPGTTGTFSNEVSDWARDVLTFSNGSTQLQFYASRLSPAVLVSTSATSLRMFSGNLKRNTFNGSSVSSLSDGPSYPKYVAYSSGGTVRVRALTTSAFALPALDQKWLLVWYGSNSHFVDTKNPMSYELSIPQTNAFKADAPMLIVFPNTATTINQSSEGGIDIAFSSSAGNVAILPLYGRNILRANDTETWATSFPASVTQKAQWWASHLCYFPNTASETYSYNSATDTATITESFTFLSVCSSGTRLAPIPPMLGIAKNALGVTFSGTVVDGGLPTEFGPSLGIENATSYSWNLTGYKKYSDGRKVVTNSGSVPASFNTELQTEVNRLVTAGHMAPWIFLDRIPRYEDKGDLYWANPGDIVYHLAEVIPALPDSAKTSAINYMKSERTNCPPETMYSTNLTQGTLRKDYSFYGAAWEYVWVQECNGACPHQLKKVPLYNFYALSRYYDITSEAVSATVMTKAKTVLDQDMAEQDWATFSWFQRMGQGPYAVVNANRHFAGLVGLIRLSVKAGDTQTESLARALFAKAIVLRVAEAQYPRYLYTNGMVELPSDPAWLPKYTAGYWVGQLFNYSWAGAYDDPRQVVTMDQFSVHLHEINVDSIITGDAFGTGFLVGYQNLTPELARLLSDKAKADADVLINKALALFPHWYAAFAEGTLGAEHNLSYPTDSFQLFLAKAWIDGETAANLARYADISWLSQGGDLFYIQKLAEAAKVYRGVAWQDPLGQPILANSAFAPLAVAAQNRNFLPLINVSVPVAPPSPPPTSTPTPGPAPKCGG